MIAFTVTTSLKKVRGIEDIHLHSFMPCIYSKLNHARWITYKMMNKSIETLK
jgi:hypothetical protein